MYTLVKLGQADSEKRTFTDYMNLFKHIAQGQGQITTGNKILIVTKKFYNFNHTFYASAISLSYILRK